MIRSVVFAFWALLITAGTALAACNAQDNHLLRWASNPWPSSGALGATYNVPRTSDQQAPVNVAFAFTANGATFDANSPQVSTFITGGSSAPTLNFTINSSGHVSNSTPMALKVTFARPVENVSFTVSDVDYSSPSFFFGGFRDHVRVTGANGATAVTPSAAAANTNVVQVVGNVAQAQSTQVPQSARDGNVTFSFAGPITEFTLEFGTAQLATLYYAAHAVGLQDLRFCAPRSVASITSTKQVRLIAENATIVACSNFSLGAAPVSAAIVPGACIEYVITLTNSGNGPATALALNDQLAPQLRFVAANMAGFGTSVTLTSPARGTACGGTACLVGVAAGQINPGASATLNTSHPQSPAFMPG